MRRRVGAGDLVAKATGTWDCSVQFGEDVNEVTVDVDADGGFTLTAGDDRVDGTWQRDGDEVAIATDQPFYFRELTYQGATDEPEQLAVVEDEGHHRRVRRRHRRRPGHLHPG